MRPRSLHLGAALLVAVLAATAVAGQALATTAIRVKVTTRPPAYSASSTALFKWKATGAKRTLCSLDRKRFGACRRSKRVKGLHDGKHTFRIKAISSTGKSKTATASWRVDTTAPTAPNVTGGSSSWQNVPSIAISANGSTDGGSGLAGYQSRVSTDGGVTWSAPVSGAQVNATADTETLVEFRAVDRAHNVSAWSPAPGDPAGTARIDRDAPAPPTVTGGTLQWQNAASVDVVASGGADVGGAGLAYYQYRTSTDGGVTWSAPTVGSDASVSADGETIVQFQGVDGAGNASAWAPAAPDDGSTVRLDRTLPTNPTVTGATAGWQNIASTLVSASGSSDGTGGSGIAYYEYRTSTDGGSTWSAPTTGTSLSVSAEGETIVEFHAVDNTSLASAWIPAVVEIDRTNPTDPTVIGGSSAWLSVPQITIGAVLSTDSGGSGLAGYQYRTSTDGGATWSGATAGPVDVVSSEGETLVQFRAIDGAGNTSNWVQDTARIDRTLPTDPNVAGGSLSWQAVPSVDVTASGSTDAGGSSLSSYQYRASTDGGSTWSAPVNGADDTVSAQGTTIVQFRAVDGAGNTSAWAPAAAGAANTVKLDHTAPTLSGVSGGSLAWKSSASLTITAGSAADTGGSGFSHDQYRTSTDGGTTWSTPTSGTAAVISAEGETIVQFQSVDNAGNTSSWVPASPGASNTVRLDRTNPTAPSVTGGSATWQSVPSILLSASGSTDLGSGLAGYQYRTSTDGGATWSSPVSGSSDTISNQGATQVGFRSVDNVGKTSAWVVANANIDRTAPSAPNVTGGSATWQSVASITVKAAGATDTGGSGLAGSGYQYRTSTDGGATWSAPTAGASLTVSAEGETLVQYQSIDNAGNTSAWVQGTARIDRTAPTTPNVSGGSSSWQGAPSVTITASGSTDSGGSGFSYQYRTSPDGVTWSAPVAGSSDTVSAEGTVYLQFQAIDGAGNASAWAPAANGAGNTVKIDRTAPTAPTVTGGSSSWQSVASVTISAGSSSDATSGLAGYDYRTSTDGGTTWTAPVAGSSAVISAEGTTIVQFRSRDNAGNTSAWTPSSSAAGNTAKIDRTLPAAPTSVTGGSLSWMTSAVTITAAGGSDAGSGFKGYNVRTSTNGGTTWSAAIAIAGSTYQVTTDGTTLVQFQSVDNAGNVSAWTPASPGAGNTVKLDTVAPTLPTVSGGFGASCKHRATVTASGSTDATSGLAHYDYRVSTNNGATWGAIVTNKSSVTFTTAGTYIVQFRAVDNAGNISAWAPATATSGSTACIR